MGNPEVIEDQEDFMAHISNQAFEKVDQHLGDRGAAIKQEAHRPGLVIAEIRLIRSLLACERTSASVFILGAYALG